MLAWATATVCVAVDALSYYYFFTVRFAVGGATATAQCRAGLAGVDISQEVLLSHPRLLELEMIPVTELNQDYFFSFLAVNRRHGGVYFYAKGDLGIRGGATTRPNSKLAIALMKGLYCPLLCLLVATAYHRLRARRRAHSGLCLLCAYDLRGSSTGNCPECGAARLVKVTSILVGIAQHESLARNCIAC